ncbi:MAG: type III pantothenate kinase [Chromatiales bacterium]|nr:type III pantothenate kinase [Chromatiales bacterium]
MKLLVDVGNSRVKWGFSTAAGLIEPGEARHDEAEELRALLDAQRAPDEILMANVAGAGAGARLAARLEERFGVSPVFARSAATGAGVRSGYADPSQLGVDRWLAICAAFARYRAPVCVVDTGTATTIDVVNGRGEHQGGLILPGIALMQSSLLGGTGDLARLSASKRAAGKGAASPDAGPGSGGRALALGRDTAAAIRDGAVQATACLIRSCLSGMGDTSSPGEGAEILVLTGGAAPLLEAALLRMGGMAGSGRVPGFRLEHRPWLVLEGLALDPACFGVDP